MNSTIFTFRGCRIEVASGRQTATAKRILTGESAEFASKPEGPTAEVQAQYWAMGQTIAVPAEAEHDEPTELDENHDSHE